MDSNVIITILSIFLPLIGGGIGFFIKGYVDRKRELTNEITKERREMYQQYINLIIGLLSDSKANKKPKQGNFLVELYRFQKKYILYASPRVIIAFSEYFQFVYRLNEDEKPDAKQNLIFLTRIMVEMRKDLGLTNKGLGKDGEMLLKAIIRDYDSIFRI